MVRVDIEEAQCARDTNAFPDGTLLFSHPAGLSRVDDHPEGGTFVRNCFDYLRELPGKRCAKMRNSPSWPRSWANSLCSHRNAWANLSRLGQPDIFLAKAHRKPVRWRCLVPPSNITILTSADGGARWRTWASNFWRGFPYYPWDPPPHIGTPNRSFPNRAGYSSMAYVPAKDSGSVRAEVYLLFEGTGEQGPLQLMRFDATDGSVIR